MKQLSNDLVRGKRSTGRREKTVKRINLRETKVNHHNEDKGMAKQEGEKKYIKEKFSCLFFIAVCAKAFAKKFKHNL